MSTFNFDSIQEVLNPNKFIDQAEKNTQAILAYVEPKELSKTLISLTSAQADYARATVESFKSIQAIAKTTTEQFAKNFEKAVNTK